MDDLDLGTDLALAPDLDLDEDEGLVEGLDCLAQDVVLRLDSPTGLADGSEDGALWGYDLAGNLGDQLTLQRLLGVVVDCELQIQQDDRVQQVQGDAAYDPAARSLTVRLDVETSAGPHALTVTVTDQTVPQLVLQQVGRGA